MRNFFRIMVAVAIAVMSIASIGGVAVAATGSITGYVYADNGTALLSAHVVAYLGGVSAAGDLTDNTGYYSITGLGTGSYRLKADAVGYFSEWYNGKSTIETADPVSVIDGSATTGKSFNLTPGRSIRGTVRSDNGTELQDIHISVYNSSWVETPFEAYSDVNGEYSVATGSGDWYVRARTNGWAAEYWENTTQPEAIPVTVSDSADTTDIDFSLTQIGYISGTVYIYGTSTVITTASIGARWSDNAGYVPSSGHSGASNGFYYVNLGPGDYRIWAEADGYMTQWCDNVTVVSGDTLSAAYWNAARPITVSGVENPNNNFYLFPVKDVTTNAESNVATTSATLNGTLVSKGASENVTVSFEYGTVSGGPYTPTAGQVVTSTGDFSANVSSLTPNTIYYFKAKAVGDVDTVPFYGDEGTFTTDALGSPVVATGAATSLATTTATLNGNLTDLGTATSVDVSFEWGLTDAYGATTTAVAKDSAGAFSANLTDLTAKTTYHFRAKAVSAHGNDSGEDMTFTTSTIAPTVTTNAASSVATTTATLNGNLASKGTAGSVVVSFEWGTAAGGPYTSLTDNQTVTDTGAFTANLTGLTPGTAYYYKAKAVGDDTVRGDQITFTTSTTPPAVTTDNATPVAATSATLKGNLTSMGTASSVIVSFEWGTATGAYTYTTDNQTKTSAAAFSANLSGLTAAKAYYYRAKVVVGSGTPVYGAEKTFTTSSLADTTAPVISVVNATDFTKTGATITWTTNEAATSQVEYGLTAEYGSATTLDANAVTSHSVALTGLKAGKTYHYRVISKDAASNQAVSADGTFKTTGGSGGMPAWAWVIIGLAAVGVIGGGAYFASTKMAKK